jgi:hypothetical protein
MKYWKIRNYTNEQWAMTNELKKLTMKLMSCALYSKKCDELCTIKKLYSLLYFLFELNRWSANIKLPILNITQLEWIECYY